ncbi:MAG TPA: entericidin A/B family lipoprotein [Burkholderiales bacterium]|nr:entericidin A/B family lipoprotein [Burkholderiales bacterium]
MLKIVLLATVLVAVLAGCNTMEGLGKDLSKLGDKIEKKADEKKN